MDWCVLTQITSHYNDGFSSSILNSSSVCNKMINTYQLTSLNISMIIDSFNLHKFIFLVVAELLWPLLRKALLELLRGLNREIELIFFFSFF